MKIIYGLDAFLVNQELNKLLDQDYSGYEACHYDYENQLELLQESIDQISLNLLPKVYILHNFNGLINLDNFHKFIPFLNLIKSSDNQVIFLCSQPISKAKNIQGILKDFQLIWTDELTEKNLENYLNKWLKDHQITLSNPLIENLTNRLIPDALLIENELSKLVGHSIIDQDLINHLIYDYKDANLLNLSEYIITSDYSNAFKLYHKIKSQKTDEAYLINIISSQLIKYYFLKSEMVTNPKGIEKYGFHPYWLRKNMDLLRNISLNKIKYILDNVYLYDIQSKSNKVDKTIGFEALLIFLMEDNNYVG